MLCSGGGICLFFFLFISPFKPHCLIVCDASSTTKYVLSVYLCSSKNTTNSLFLLSQLSLSLFLIFFLSLITQITTKEEQK